MRTVTHDGIVLHVHEAGTGIPLLLLHGFPLDHRMWAGQAPLAGAARLLVPDQRGFGRSTGAAPASIEQLAADAAAVLEALAGGRRAVVCGLSMGGYVAQHLVVQRPDLVAALVLVNTKLEADSAETRAARHDLADRVARCGQRALAEAMLPRLLSQSPHGHRRAARAADEALLRDAILHTPLATITAALAALAARPDMTRPLTGLPRPTLLVAGGDDVITPPDCLARAAALIPGATMRVVEGCGHMVPLEDPEAFNASVVAFLDGLPDRGVPA